MPVEKSKFNIYKIKESNVLPCQIIKKDCHFYGVNDASNKKKIYDYFLNFFLISSALRMWDPLLIPPSQMISIFPPTVSIISSN